MSVWSLLYIFFNIACVGALIYLIVLLTPKRDIPASKVFIFTAGILILWLTTLTYQVTISFSENQVIFMHRLNESVFLFVPISLVFLVDKYATVTRIMKRWVFIMFGVMILTIIGLIWTNQYHHLVWTVETIVLENDHLLIMAQKTMIFKVFMVIQHLTIAFAAFHFLTLTILLNRVYQRVTNAINLSLALTSIISAIVLINTADTPYNLLPIALTAVIFSVAHLIIEHNIFDLALISRVTYFQDLADGAIITSNTGTILDISKQIERIIGEKPAQEMIGQDILENFPQWKTVFRNVVKTHLPQSTTISLYKGPEAVEYDISLRANKDMYGYVSTILIKFTDVTFYHQLIEQVNELAIRDPLTGVLNRRHFELLVNDHLKLAQRYQRVGCLLMFDLDDFKHINDFYGHQIGDKVLIEFCAQMNTLIRESDIFARYGGDEFVLFLPETDCDGAMKAVQNYKQFILGTTIEIDDLVIPLKCSSGAVPINEENVTLSYEELIKRADTSMCSAKAKGPNTIGIMKSDEISYYILELELPHR